MKMKLKLRTLLLIFIFLGVGVLVFSTDLTVTPTTPANHTNYTTGFVDLLISVSPASNTSNCEYVASYSNGTERSAVQMTNLTLTNTSYGNESAFTPELDNSYGKWHNLNFTCTNLTSGQTFSSYVEYGYDTTNPTIDQDAISIGNASLNGNNITHTFNSTDVHNDGCKARIYHADGNSSTVEGSWEEYIQDRQCNVEITYSDFGKSGQYTLEAWSNDTLGNSDTSSTNFTLSVYKLKTGWNLISISENATLGAIGGMIQNVSYVSVYDNIGKSYTTYTVGSSTNQNYRTNSTNATYIYVTQDVTLIREHNSDSFCRNVTLYKVGTDGWNQIGSRDRYTLNQTLYNATGNVYKYDGTLDSTYTGDNITYVSYYNSTQSKYCTAYRGFKQTSCSPTYNVTDITVERGQGLWVLVDANITLDRGA